MLKSKKQIRIELIPLFLVIKINFIGKYFGNFVLYNHLSGLNLARDKIMNTVKYCTRITSM